jgi:8-oxo-dGTP diphosphatase
MRASPARPALACGSTLGCHARVTDWTRWKPREHANLCFILDGGRVLLIRKKRGFGAGKINGPGGKLEPGETPLQSAIRETQEEIGVTPQELEEAGVLHFQFADGYSLLCTVFLARAHAGEPIETEEALPLWFALDAIPFEQMWADDRHWLPDALAGRRFDAWFEFEGETMLTHEIRWHDAPPALAPPPDA